MNTVDVKEILKSFEQTTHIPSQLESTDSTTTNEEYFP